MMFLRTRPFKGAAYANRQRHPRWQEIARQHLRRFPTCAACGSRRNPQVHHIVPVSDWPEGELEPSNLLTLCTSYDYGVNCHLYHGHLGDWSRSNPTVIADSLAALQRVTLRIVTQPQTHHDPS